MMEQNAAAILGSGGIRGIRCPQCGGFVERDARLCPWCRAEVDGSSAALVPADYDMDETMGCCPACGAPMRMTHRYCGQCGSGRNRNQNAGREEFRWTEG